MALEFKNSSMTAMGATLVTVVKAATEVKLDLVATIAAMRVIGNYIHKAKVEDIDKAIAVECEELKVKSSSGRAAYVATGKKLAIRLCLDKGYPHSAVASQFWQDVAACADFETRVAFVVAYIKTDLGAFNMSQLGDALAGAAKAQKAEVPLLDRMVKAIDTDGADVVALVTGLAAHYGLTAEVLAALTVALEDKSVAMQRAA